MAEDDGSIEAALVAAAQLGDTRPELTLEQAQAVLAAVPGHPQAQLLAGRALRLLGRTDEACARLAALAAAAPRSAVTQFELGLAMAATGAAPAAIAALQRATALKPELVGAWLALADLQRLEGDDVEADRAYLASVRASTPEPLLAEAALALSDNQLSRAEPLLRQRLRSHPTDVVAIRMLGELALRLGRIDDGITLLRRTLELAPGFSAARALLARTLSRANRLPEALVEATTLLVQTPDNPSNAMLKASLMAGLGDHDGARLVYEATLARHPHQPKGWMRLGHVLTIIGRQADAIAAYRRALGQQATLGEAWWHLAGLNTVRFSADDIATMRAALAVAGNEDDRLHLHFALGKALEDAREDAEAFRHYAEGNRLRRAQIDYDAAETHDASERSMALFTRDFFIAHGGRGCPAPDPIFIVGLPHSGLMLIEQILSRHSQIEAAMVRPDVIAIAARLDRDGGYPERLADLPPAQLRALGEDYIERTRACRTTGKPHFIDTMPDNWAHVGLIQLILPNARIIDARRHPMGCCLSVWKQHFTRSQNFSYDLEDVGRYYCDYVATMAAFDCALPGRVHRVSHEHMVADTRGEVERLLAWLGLPFEDACLEQADRPVPAIGDDSDDWQRFEAHLGPLAAALESLVACYPDEP